MDKLEELERKWRDRSDKMHAISYHGSPENQCDALARSDVFQDCADEIQDLRRDYVLVPREPTQEDVERVALRLHLLLGHRGYVVPAEREPFTSMPEPWQEDFKAMSELLWAAIVGEGTRGGTDEA